MPSGWTEGDAVGVEGRTALVTGSNRGIGAALVTALLDRGASKVYAGARDVASLSAAQHRHGGRLVPVRLDVTSPADRAAVGASCTDVDLVVSNAGVSAVGPVLDVDDAAMREMFDVNVFGPLALLRALAPALRAHRGGVILVHSLSSLILSRSAPAYAASKAASLMVGQAVREELRAADVVVTNVLPGFVETDMTTQMTSVKAAPLPVANRILDGWERGDAVVWPDRYAQVVRAALRTDMDAILDDPAAVATRLVQGYATDPLRGT